MPSAVSELPPPPANAQHDDARSRELLARRMTQIAADARRAGCVDDESRVRWIRRILQLDEMVRDAQRAGNVDAVRAHAKQLISEYPSTEAATSLAARALLWCGDLGDALQHLSPDDHTFRARAHAHLRQFDEARRELELARQAGDPNTEDETEAIGHLDNISGGSSWVRTKKHSGVDDLPHLALRRAYTHFWRGDWHEGQAAIKNARAAYPHRGRAIGCGPLSRLGREDCPLWDGKPVGHLLLFSHFGNGDFLQFGRYVRHARARCDRLTLALERPLQAIAKRTLPVDDVIALFEVFPFLQRADAYEALNMHLPGALGIEYDTPMRIDPLPGTVPDLGTGAHIGLCWAASAGTADNGPARTLPFSVLKSLQSWPGVRFHSLQVGVAADEAAKWVTRHDLRTYDDTTSLIAALDAVVTVDTSVAHLAANIGKPVHLILTTYEDWRWEMGDSTPWYPTMTIYRGNVRQSLARIRERVIRPSPALQSRDAQLSQPGRDDRHAADCTRSRPQQDPRA